VLALEHRLPGDPAAWFPEGAPDGLRALSNDDVTAPPASGSSAPRAMIVVPCSMGTAARLATGVSATLLERAGDVMLKERRPLVIVPRESPLSTLHLRNLLTLSELGAVIVPAMPAFYAGPMDVEDMLAFVVDRAIAAAGIDLPLRHRWRAPGSDEVAGEEPR
jgi:4-hydroxy-3-polyprenylbenzoate decarboxylase